MRKVRKPRAPRLPKGDPMIIARQFLKSAEPTLRRLDEAWYVFDQVCYVKLSVDQVHQKIWLYLDRASVTDRGGGVRFQPKTCNVKDVENALVTLTLLVRPRSAQRFWCEASGPDPAKLIVLQNGLLHVETRDLLTPTPAFFAEHALGFAYDPGVPPPMRWLKFLAEVFETDAERSLLQEICGYLLTPDKSQQKVFMVIGPPRSGKGIIGQIMTALVGDPFTTTMGFENATYVFDRQKYLNKRLALATDLNLSPKADTKRIRDMLLRASGGDRMAIERKRFDAAETDLEVRFVLMGNMTPRISDPAGALRARTIPLVTSTSFVGREDLDLLTNLEAELPGIMNWALDGYARLQQRGRFEVPQVLFAKFDAAAAPPQPIERFIEECCEVIPGAKVGKDILYQAWVAWCSTNGIEPEGKSAFGGRLYRALGWHEKSAKVVTSDKKRVHAHVGIRLRPRRLALAGE